MGRVYNREQRQLDARQRRFERDRRGDRAQLIRLEAAGHSHCKEVKRIRKRLDKRRKQEVTEDA